MPCLLVVVEACSSEEWLSLVFRGGETDGGFVDLVHQPRTGRCAGGGGSARESTCSCRLGLGSGLEFGKVENVVKNTKETASDGVVVVIKAQKESI